MKLNPNHPAIVEGRPLHNTIKDPAANATPILKSVADNTKLGNGFGVITKGKWIGFPLFSLTLPERSTCPPDCLRWAECYGNSMPFAHRFAPGAALEARLAIEIAALANRFPRGFAIRLHILGDFYSVEYVEFWRSMLAMHPALHIYGYTAHYNNPIQRAIKSIRIRYGSRFWVRYSRNDKSSLIDIFASQAEKALETNAIVCPEQTGRAKSCLDCGLCWSVNKTIAFIDHDALAKQRKKAKNAQAESV